MNIKNIFYRKNDSSKPLYVRIINGSIVSFLFIILLIVSYYYIVSPNLNPDETVLSRFKQNIFKIYQYKANIISGFKLTIVISVVSLFVSLFFGLIGFLSQLSKVQPIHYIGKIYVLIIRGTPLLVQIIAIYYFVGVLFRLNDKFWAGVITLSLFEGAYITEIIRSGVQSISRTQIETARSLCLTKKDTYFYIIIPQVIRRIVPPLAGQFVSLIKDSSLLSIIALSEFTLTVQNVTALNFNYTEGYIILGIGYFILTICISNLSKYLEAKFLYDS